MSDDTSPPPFTSPLLFADISSCSRRSDCENRFAATRGTSGPARCRCCRSPRTTSSTFSHSNLHSIGIYDSKLWQIINFRNAANSRQFELFAIVLHFPLTLQVALNALQSLSPFLLHAKVRKNCNFNFSCVKLFSFRIRSVKQNFIHQHSFSSHASHVVLMVCCLIVSMRDIIWILFDRWIFSTLILVTKESELACS